MSTRSVTQVKDIYLFEGTYGEKTFVNMYRQSDGYPSSHGVDLAEFLEGMVIGYGIGSNIGVSPGEKYANGLGCLAAQMVQHFKAMFGVGGIYLEPLSSGATRYDYISYLYTIYQSNGVDSPLKIRVYSTGEKKVLFNGPVTDYLEWVKHA